MKKFSIGMMLSGLLVIQIGCGEEAPPVSTPTPDPGAMMHSGSDAAAAGHDAAKDGADAPKEEAAAAGHDAAKEGADAPKEGADAVKEVAP